MPRLARLHFLLVLTLAAACAPAPTGTLSNHLALVYDPSRDRIVLFGGQDLNELVKSDSWEWEPEKRGGGARQRVARC
jgi:hypothetical protein